ncbi:vegetative incompatibility protein het-e-1 [Phlyctema vagabunda]|uniref:Vegetative incompatibility protein het-e-1 n=1 Tax=Phlyctema vagabunda TaxID=108571 RepID=A0ABR4PEZ9_9HELO
MDSNISREKAFYDACMQILNVTNPMDDVRRIQDGSDGKNKLLDGTCSWVNETAQYKKWQADESCSILWIHGDAGKGKTMLAISQVHGFMDGLPLQDVDDSVLACFFCDDKDESKKSAIYIIRSLLYQILDKQPELFRRIKVEFERKNDQLLTGSNAQQTLWRLLDEVLSEVTNPVWFVIDALDECEECSRSILLHSILARFGNSEANEPGRIKWLFTSRSLPLIKEILVDETLELDLAQHEDEVANDVQLYIETEVSLLYKKKKAPRQHQEEIKRMIQEKAEGTFLWVSLALTELRNKSWVHQKAILNRLPKGLDQIYTKLLKSILETEDAEFVKSILTMVLVAARPLTFFELAELASLPYSDDFDAIEAFLEDCGPLVITRHRTAYLVHQSAKDFLATTPLTAFSENLQAEHGLMMVRSFNYVVGGVFENGEIDLSITHSYEVCLTDPSFDRSNVVDDTIQPPTKPEILKYPVGFWMQHAKFAGPYVKQYLGSPLHDFFLPKSRVFEAWLKTWMSSGMGDMMADDTTALHVAASFGVLPLVELLLDNSVYPAGSASKDGITPFFKACEANELSIARLLMSHGADIDIDPSQINGVPSKVILLVAARNGRIGVLKLLLESGADVNMRNQENGRTALHEAARMGQVESAKLLLQWGAEVNAEAVLSEWDTFTPLHYAVNSSRIDNSDMIRLLLDAGANPQARFPEDCRSPLELAAASGRDKYVELFLERGVDVNEIYQDERPDTVWDWSTYTPLQHAVRQNHESTVRILLKGGGKVPVNADFKLTSNWDWVSEKNPTMYSMLLQHVAEHAASEDGREKGLIAPNLAFGG